MKNVSLAPIVTRLGAIIAFPVVILVPLAVFLDRIVGTMPFITLGSLFVAAGISTFFVVRLVSN